MELKLPLSKKQKTQNVQACTVVEEENVSIQDNVQEEPFIVLQKLMSEEAKLTEEKEKLHAQLASLREKRRLKLQRKIRRKKNSIQKLRVEIKDLKFSCEELSKSLRHAHTVGTK
jgi:predicted RNase H-like nuclease (RuvC/YqgF family)